MGFQKKQESIIGTRQGIFEVMYECDFKSNDGHRMFHVKCSECGWESNIQMHQIKYTTVCRHTDSAGNYIIPYVWKNKRIGNIFSGMKQRCYNSKDKAYRWYGAKGIKICNEWLNNPLLFEEWSLSHGYQDNLSIDRLKSDKDYCPENCCWLPLGENSRKAGVVNWLEIDGNTKTGREWAEYLGLGLMTINKYLRIYPKEKVKELISAVIADPSLVQKHARKSHQTWFDVYGIKI